MSLSVLIEVNWLDSSIHSFFLLLKISVNRFDLKYLLQNEKKIRSAPKCIGCGYSFNSFRHNDCSAKLDAEPSASTCMTTKHYMWPYQVFLHALFAFLLCNTSDKVSSLLCLMIRKRCRVHF